MKNTAKEYSNGDITIIWKPDICIHSKRCWSELLEVFDPRKRPWVDMNGADTERIIKQVQRCPSGALSFYQNDTPEPITASTERVVEVSKNGPLLVHGNLVVKDAEGQETRRSKVTAFCRCGASANKPFCDGSHHKIQFNDEQSE